MYSINYISVTDHKRAYKECFANLHIVTFNLGMSAILNSQMKLVSKARLSSFAMTSVHSHWLTAKPFVLSLDKYDTTRRVGRLLYSTAIYTSLLIALYTYTYASTLHLINPPHIYLHSLHLINPPHTPSQRNLINPLIHLHIFSISPHSPLLIKSPHIPKNPTCQKSTLIYLHSPHMPTDPSSQKSPLLYLHSPLLINPPHIPTHPKS